MDPKSTIKMTNKDVDKLETEYARGKVSIQGIISEQERIMAVAETEKTSLAKKIISMRSSLRPYTEGKDMDDDFFTIKREYALLVIRRGELEKTIQVCTESIASAKLNLI